MAFIDHDLHIHSRLSPCSGEKGKTQTPENILKYALENSLRTICVTDHFWDETIEPRGYANLDYALISQNLPLPQNERVRFLFGCETEMDKNNVIGIAPEHYGRFDFIIIPTVHLHLKGITCVGTESAEERAALWCSRLDCALEQPGMPYHKVGIAHLTDTGIMGGRYLEVLQMISDEQFSRLFRKAADRGVGIELNFDWRTLDEEQLKIHLRPYAIAKEEGCKFYLGSDAHSVPRFEGMRDNFRIIVDALGLDDSHKFHIDAL